MSWYFVGLCSGVSFVSDHLNARVELITLTGLDKEHLWFSRQGGTLVSREVAPQPVRLEGLVAAVQDSKLAVGHDCHKNTVRVGVIIHRSILQYPVHFFEGQVIVNLDLKVQLPQGHPQVVPVIVGSVPRLEVQPGVKVHVVEDEGFASPPVVHVVGLRVLIAGHGSPLRPSRPGPLGPPLRVHSVSAGRKAVDDIDRGLAVDRDAIAHGQVLHDIYGLLRVKN